MCMNQYTILRKQDYGVRAIAPQFPVYDIWLESTTKGRGILM